MYRVKRLGKIALLLCCCVCWEAFSGANAQIGIAWEGRNISFYAEVDVLLPLLFRKYRTSIQDHEEKEDGELDRKVYRVDPRTDSLRWVATYDPSTHQVEGEKSYFDWVYMYSLDHLQNDESHWQTEEYKEKEELLVRTYYPFGNRKSKTVNLWYDENDRIKEIQIRNHFNYATPTHKLTEQGKENLSLPFRETITFEFYSGGDLKEKKIFAEDRLRYREVFLYDTKGRIQASTYYTIKQGREEPFLTIAYRYQGDE